MEKLHDNMKGVIETLSKNIKVKVQFRSIDNLIFKLHYRFTTIAFFAIVIIISAQELTGENIRCIADKGVEENVINRFCYFTPTYTVVKYYDPDLIHDRAVAHPGVGATGLEIEEEVIRHAYYQWVPFMLAFQGILFYLPHVIWKAKEGGRIKKLADSVEFAAYSSLEKPIKVGTVEVPTKEAMEKTLGRIRGIFKDRLIVTRSWASWLIFCEFLNVVNVIGNVFLTNWFLAGQFMSLGVKFCKNNPDEADILDVVFPKITKCTFYKYGPSGTIQAHDAMCVMALNIINEKAYVFLWFWFIILFILSVGNLFWRLISLILHARSYAFNKLVFGFQCPGKLNPWHVVTVTRQSSFLDWLFLLYLSHNMDGLVFSNFFIKLAEDYDNYYTHSDTNSEDTKPIYSTPNKYD